MRIRRGYLGWGVFLILAGAIPLLVRSGYLDAEQVDRLWSLWPLILVGIGVGLILSRTRFDFIGGLIVAATFGLMVGGLLASGVETFSTGACGSDEGKAPFGTQQGSFTGSTADVDIRMNCGNVSVAVAAGTSWSLAGSDEKGIGPTVTASDDALEVRSRDRDGGPFAVFGAKDSWQLTLPATPRLDVDLTLNAGSATMDLGQAAIGRVDLTLNAGSTVVDLTDVTDIEGIDFTLNAGSVGLTLPNRSMTGSIQANAGAVRMCAPAGAGLRLQTGSSVIASYDYADAGLVQDGSVWTTPGFDTAAVRIDLRTQANAGSFSLNPEDGCD